MNSPVDRDRIHELLQDESRSLRSIAREVGCSDWTVRSIDRQLRGDSRPMKQSRSAPYPRDQEATGLMGWAIAFGLFGIIGAALWFLRRPPTD